MEEQNRQIRKKKIIIPSLIAGLILSFPVTGYFHGFYVCKDCGTGVKGVLGRMFIGVVDAVLTTISLGAPWDNEAGTTSTNLRWYVLISCVILSTITYLIMRFKNRRAK